MQSLRALAKQLYGEVKELDPEIVEMFLKGLSIPTISKTKEIPAGQAYKVIVDDYMSEGKLKIRLTSLNAREIGFNFDFLVVKISSLL